MAAVANPSSVSLLCLLDPQANPQPTPPRPQPLHHSKYIQDKKQIHAKLRMRAPRAWQFSQAAFLLVQAEQITLLAHARRPATAHTHTHTHTHVCARRDSTQTTTNVEMDCHSALEKKNKNAHVPKTTGDAIIPLKWPRLHRANVIRKLQRWNNGGGRKSEVRRRTKPDEKPTCSQWGETENLRNMAAPCCNASTLQRVALSLRLFIISRSKAPAKHRLWGKKKREKSQRVCKCAHIRLHVQLCLLLLHIYVCVCVCVCVSPRHPY